MNDEPLIIFPSSEPSQPDQPIDPKLKRAQSLVGTSKGRPEHDFYRTPPEAIEALLLYEKFEGTIWEPACGDGAICEVLKAHGHTVLATDLIDRGYGEGNHDFFTSPYTAENIITNPPYKLGEDFCRHSLAKTTGKVVMLMKLAFLEGAKRKVFFQSSPLARVYVFSKRLSMYRNGEDGKYANGGMIPFAHFVWEHGYTGDPVIRWI